LVGRETTEGQSVNKPPDRLLSDRLNIGKVKTIQLHWMQPHEGNIIDFLFRARAFQNTQPPSH